MKFKILIFFIIVIQHIKAQPNIVEKSQYQLIYIDTVEFSSSGFCYYEFIKNDKTFQVLSSENLENKSDCLNSLKVGCYYDIDLIQIYRVFLDDSSFILEFIKVGWYGKKNCISVGGSSKQVYKCNSIYSDKILCSIDSKYGYYEDL